MHQSTMLYGGQDRLADVVLYIHAWRGMARDNRNVVAPVHSS